MKSIVLPGDRGEAACETCQAFTSFTYEYRPLRRTDGIVVEQVMQGVCDRCRHAVVVAGQSTHRIAEAISDQKKRRTKILLPLELSDFIGLSLSRAGLRTTEVETYLRALFQTVLNAEDSYGRKLAELRDPVLDRAPVNAVNLTLTDQLERLLNTLKKKSSLRTTSEVVRALIVLSDTDKSMGEAVRLQLQRTALVA